MPLCARHDCVHFLRGLACVDCVWSAPDRRDRYQSGVPKMLPSELTLEEIEYLLGATDFYFTYGRPSEEERDLDRTAREKLARYARGECSWHGRVG